MHQARQGGFADATWPAEQGVQPAWRIEHGSFCLLRRDLESLIAADERVEAGHDCSNSH